MLTRRDSLRLLGLSSLAVSPLLAACGDRGAGAAPAGDSMQGLRLVSAQVSRSAGDAAAIPDVVTAMGGFTADLWSHLGTPGDNLALSPYSIAVALAMTANGAAGRTQAQMLDVLHVGSLASYNAGIDALTQQVLALAGPVTQADGTPDEIALATANQLFGDAETQWGRAFLTVLAKEYGAGMRTVDFRTAAEAARQLVNQWTASQTHDRIPTILPPGSVDSTTRLVLVNALYLKAPWGDPFDKSLTAPRAFTRADGSRVQAPMMQGDPAGAGFVSGSHYTAARLPYAGGKLAMTLVLPDTGYETEALAALLGDGLTAAGQPGVHVELPRFTFRTPSGLKQPLIELGMPLAFGDLADFSPMSPTTPLLIDDVLHQAFVAVDESGTEAAAATAVVMRETSGSVGGHTLVCDRPFLFVVHDTAHGTPLFVGRVADPTS
ncbi:serpin family protein [Nocardioides cynanchi]|uniref:serpin family protein n=1 Tax=Nocardioides cynanchi TaxID=2558918 RepID=UPI00192DE0C8|nr:serpin family protein [Nocardioides cynanchi]